MNDSQKKIMIATAAVILAMTIYPPFHGTWHGNSMDFGYAFITNPPNAVSSINAGTLIIQYIVASILGGALFMLSKDKK